MFAFAQQPYVVRAYEKDQFYLADFRKQVRDFAGNALGRASVHYKDEVDLLVDMSYFAFSALGRPTLGEEYCDMVQVCVSDVTSDNAGRWVNSTRLPSPSTRLCLFGMEVVLPYVYKKIKQRGRPIRSRPRANVVKRLFGSCWNLFLKLLANPSASIAAQKFAQLHLALFYLSGAYLQVSKRLAGVRLASLRQPEPNAVNYQLLGTLIIIQLIVSWTIYVRSFIGSKTQNSAGELVNNLISTDSEEQKWDDEVKVPKCILCLSERESSTVTECGHLFCWECIAEWLTNKPECPMCRQKIQVTELVRVAQYP